MLTQKNLLRRYKELNPKDTFQTISLKTGIQITRVFRIFNGSEMKLSEYLSFETLIQSSLDSENFIHKAKECIERLSLERIDSLTNQMEHALKMIEFSQSLQKQINNQHIYA